MDAMFPEGMHDEVLAGSRNLTEEKLERYMLASPSLPLLIANSPKAAATEVQLHSGDVTIAGIWAARRDERAASMMVMNHETAWLSDYTGLSIAVAAAIQHRSIAEYTVRRPEYGARCDMMGRFLAEEAIRAWPEVAEKVVTGQLDVEPYGRRVSDILRILSLELAPPVSE